MPVELGKMASIGYSIFRNDLFISSLAIEDLDGLLAIYNFR